MSDAIIEMGGEPVESSGLVAPRARDLAERLAGDKIPFARLLACLRLGDIDIVLAEIEAEVPQSPVHDIRRFEPIAFTFDSTDERMPGIRAVRTGFPSVPHLNVVDPGEPKSLCLFEEPFVEIRNRLTSPLLVERTRDWLRLTARGELHAADQPLEPLLFGAAGRIIVPHAILSPRPATDAPLALTVSRRDDWRGGMTLVAEIATPQSVAENGRPFAFTMFWASARTHGVLTERPRSLGELHDFLGVGGHDDLIQHLRESIAQWSDMLPVLNARMVLLVVAPKTRETGGVAEAHDLWAFVTTKTVGEVGEAIGVFGMYNGRFGRLLAIDQEARGDAVPLDLLNVSITLSRAQAARLAGRAQADDRKIVAVGAGALGSQVILNAARIAFGQWTVIDHDLLLPHNVARHALTDGAVGFGKATAIVTVANDVGDSARPAFSFLETDVLAAGDNETALHAACSSAEIIVDMSASIPVSRRLVRDINGGGRRVSLFLNPKGTDLVLLSESRDRRVPLDVVEMQYYRALVSQPDLHQHLEPPSDRVRYGRSCRDVSGRISQELVAQHAAIATRALRSVADQADAMIRIWRIDAATGATTVRELQADVPIIYQVNGWQVVIDEGFRRRLVELRSAKLPSETGGVLIGSLDVEKRIAYIIDTIPAPQDSDERPTWFIRGAEGLPQEVTAAQSITGGQGEYIGEWHSHPAGHSCHPSCDDARLFAWLTSHMDVLGLPAVMLIVGDEGRIAVFVGEMIAGQMQDDNRTVLIEGIIE